MAFRLEMVGEVLQLVAVDSGYSYFYICDVGRQNDEATIISLAAQFEEARPWKDQRPPVD